MRLTMIMSGTMIGTKTLDTYIGFHMNETTEYVFQPGVVPDAIFNKKSIGLGFRLVEAHDYCGRGFRLVDAHDAHDYIHTV